MKAIYKKRRQGFAKVRSRNQAIARCVAEVMSANLGMLNMDGKRLGYALFKQREREEAARQRQRSLQGNQRQKRKVNAPKAKEFKPREPLGDFQEVKAEMARSGLVLSVGIQGHRGRKQTNPNHWMVDDDRGQRVVEYWPSKGTWYSCKTGEKGKTKDPMFLVDLAVNIRDFQEVNNFADSHLDAIASSR